ncbi:MAG: LamG domain-containing protein, partial [bacterium]|nr:LamG domain-containing protein [bacterium]
MNKYVMLAIWLLCSAVVVYGGPPPGPFNPDGDTVLLLHFDDTTYIDLSPNAFSVSMSTIAGYSDPTIGTSMYGFGKALFGAGGNINGLIIDTTGSISRTEGPITIEAWYILPSVNSTLEYSNCVLDLGAGRFLLSIRNPGIPADTSGNHYMQLVAYTLSGSPQWDYCSIRPQDGFTYDEWHHYAMVYDISEPIDVDKVKFYFDGNQIATNLGGTPITEAYWKIYYPALAAGRVWIPTAPTTNLMPFRGAVDE